MSQNFSQLIREAIQLELNVAKLYLLFHDLFPEDGDFWWQLVIEEENHAALLKTVEQDGSYQGGNSRWNFAPGSSRT